MRAISLFAAVILAVPLLMLAVPTDAAPLTEDVHGISYRSTGDIEFALSERSSFSYEKVDWYIYASGDVAYRVNGEDIETVTVSGLYVLSAQYEEGKQYAIEFVAPGGTYEFNIKITSKMSSYLDERIEETQTLSLSELLRRDSGNIAMAAMSVIVGCLMAVYIGRRKSSDRSEEI